METALISVSDKRGLAELAQALTARGVRILSTGGTAALLKREGIAVSSVSDHTGHPEILDGRVKTLHPRIHAGILARLDEPSHQQTLEEHGIPPISLVVANLYPFVETISRPGVALEEAVEQIDIGGPAMIRAAAKNHGHVTVVVDPDDYPSLIRSLQEGDGEIAPDLRRGLARKAFRHTARYDAAIADYLDAQAEPEGETCDAGSMPGSLTLHLKRRDSLRYGENPHQAAGLYVPQGEARGLAAAGQIQGKQLSFNNYLDLQGAWELCCEFDEPACAIIKHNNPCGAAVGESLAAAYEKALACDPVSAFGSVIALSRSMDAEMARLMTKLFVEAVIAPGFDDEALELLAAKKNLRVMQASAPSPQPELDFKRISGGFLVQDRDSRLLGEDLRSVARRPPSDQERNDLIFAWKVCKHVKSNAIVYAREGRTLGIGAGQMSRVDSVRLAAEKAKAADLSLKGAALASDAFFPFRDGVDAAAAAGAAAVIQPGGSVRDSEVIAAADEHSMSMLLTGMRHFRH